MSVHRGTAHSSGLEREVTWDSRTGRSQRYSKSAGGYVDNGKHSSLASAISAAETDIARGPRSSGDFHKRSW